ncbi:MAG TPA: two-component regulator propeller domain-containing protein [Melioribacteraceae bacterium]|nr:two-component regulator propeller domain-containing protein [Melioribacteraceae bacterium]
MKKSILLLFLIMACWLQAQNQWTVYKYPNLPDNRIYTMAVDHSGNKWFGTYAGLVRLTGSTWTSYYTTNSGLPNNTVYSMAIDANGHKWIGTNGGGLAYFTGLSTGQSGWTVYNTGNSNLPHNNVRYSIVIDNQSNKWIGSLGGLSKFDGQNWTNYNSSNSQLPYNEIRDMVLDQNNELWIATPDGLARFNRSQAWTVYKPSNPISSTGLPHNNIMSISIAPNGVKWIGTSGGLVRYDNTTMTTFKTSNSNIPTNSITAVAAESNSVIWLGTDQYGIVKYDGTSFTTFNTTNSNLPNNTIHFITVDAGGNKWIGTYAGLAVFNENGIVSVADNNNSIPSEFSLLQNYPNPFNPETTIRYSIPSGDNGSLNQKILLKVYDLLGSEVATLVDEYKPAGTYNVTFNAAELSSGVYFYKLSTGNYSSIKKMILIK